MFDFKKIVIILPLILGFLIGFFTKPGNDYVKLKKSKLNPPSYLFGIVWSILYLLIGFSYYLVLKKKSNLVFWIIPIVHLLINFRFSIIFFKFNNLFLSAVVTTLTLITALIVLNQFYRINKKVLLLFIPYIVWLLFATYLAWSIYFLNR
jgi:tryptophan-rich sensory protein